MARGKAEDGGVVSSRPRWARRTTSQSCVGIWSREVLRCDTLRSSSVVGCGSGAPVALGGERIFMGISADTLCEL